MTMSETEYRVRIWDGYQDEYTGEPDEVISVPEETPYVWLESPHAAMRGAFDIHPDDRPAMLNIYTSDSVRKPPGYDDHVESAYWNGPIERGLLFEDGHSPFGCGVWGRVMFFVEGKDEVTNNE